MVSRLSPATPFLSALLICALAAPLAAGERHHRYNGHRGEGHRGERSSGIVHSGLPSIVPGLGTYSGAISALRVRGNGIYVSIDGGGLPLRRLTRPAPLPKVINVSAEGSNACSYEAGVCVIRP